ncbi:MAG: radical SAM protein [Nanoarchaeota archaeon]|nr:radical SAM protein [Nanoarchaeota archaeon]
MANKPELKVGKKESKTGLNELWLEVGIDCDLRCAYCFNNAGGVRKEKGTLSIDNYLNLLKQFKDMDGKTIGITGAGEPLVKSNLETTLSIADFCRENKLHLVLFTNARQMDDNLISRLNSDHVSLMIKYNSSNPHIQDHIARLNGYTKRREKNIQKLLENKLNLDSRLGFVTSIMDINYDEIPDIFRYCRDNQIIPDFDTVLKQGRGAKCNLSSEDEKIKSVFELLQKIDRDEYGIEWLISPTYVAGCCDRYKRHMYVTRFGDVSPCIGASLKGVNLGNIKEDSLSQIWGSSLMQKIRHKEYIGECLECKNYQEEKCNSCLGRYADEINEESINTVGCWNKRVD